MGLKTAIDVCCQNFSEASSLLSAEHNAILITSLLILIGKK
jgi:hypothetical protein